jgi:hypothetical protein
MMRRKDLDSGADNGGNAERRRTQRVHIAMSVLVRVKKGNQSFEEGTQTLSVNAHGCKVHLTNRIERDDEVSIVNPKTAEELPCTVISIGQAGGDKLEVGLEFVEPSPLFWRIAFPPSDWDPAERKRAGVPRTPSPPRR